MKTEVKNTIRKYILIYIFIIIILFSILAIVIWLSGFYLQVIQNNLAFVSLINVSLVTILVFINAVYSYFTWQIVEETKYDRKVAFIEKRLEKLYYPLKDVLQNPYIMHFIGDEKNNNINLEKIDAIIPFQYLASKRLKDKLDYFIEKALKERSVNVTEFSNYASFEIVDGEIKKIVDEDIEKFKKELAEFVK